MAVTTTLKLPDELKARIAAAADSAGKTPHAFMVEALEAETHRAELRRDFVNTALKAEQEVAEYGLGYSSDEVHRYLRAKLSGAKAQSPKPAKLKPSSRR